ncbi:protein of unknown function [Methylocella tundrae]|uniref:Uncharacterized protein n=1 Tax=Methylocella tundrae TaxID=227605 RepID=A0A4V6IMU4_METTU|nr:protein of unknown function [Methylocella tundrae]
MQLCSELVEIQKTVMARRHGRIVSCAWRRKMHGQAGLTRRHRNLISEMCVERHFRVAAKVVWSGGGRAAAKSGGAFCVGIASQAAPLLAKGVSVGARFAGKRFIEEIP